MLPLLLWGGYFLCIFLVFPLGFGVVCCVCRKLNIKIWFTRPEFYDFDVDLCCCACCRDRKDSRFKHKLEYQTIANVVLVVCVGIVM